MEKSSQPIASLALPTTNGKEQITLSDLAGVSLSPYLLWAAATDYRYFQLSRRDGELEIPVLIELATSTSEGSEAKLFDHSTIEVNPLYLSPALFLRGSRYITAKVLACSFFEALRDDQALRNCVSAIDFCAPIRDKASTKESDAAQASSGLWQDGFTNKKYDELCGCSGGSDQALVLGIADDGIAFLNEKFNDTETNQSRFFAYWDQNNQPDRHLYEAEQTVAQPGYGVELSAADINKMLADSSSEASHYSRINPYRLSAARTHGTAVLGLADNCHNPHLIAVQLPVPSSGDDDSALGLGTALLDAVRFMIDRSDAWWRQQRAKRPDLALPKLVVNISYGKQAGPHDGSSLIERALDELIERRTVDGKTHLQIIFSAGNDHEVKCHARMESLPAGSHGEFCWQVLSDDSTPSFLEVYIAGESREVTVELISPNGTLITSQALPAGCAEHTLASGDTAPSVLHLKNSTGSGSWVLAALPPTVGGDINSGEWRLRLNNGGSGDVQALAWVQGDNSRPDQPRRGRQSFLLNGEGEYDAIVSTTNTLNALSTGKHTLRAGAHVRSTQQPAKYSSRGPDSSSPLIYFPVDASDNMPGMTVTGTFTGSYQRMGGTSMAAPQLSSWVLTEWASEKDNGQ